MIFLQLTYNLSLLIAMSVLISFVIQKRKLTIIQKDIIFGLLFGFVAVTGMLFPVKFAQGLIFDGRTVVISLCALFFGPVSVSVAAAGAFILRAAQGGIGVIPGVMNIITPAAIGLIFYYRITGKNKPVRVRELLVMGLSVHVSMLMLMLLLPAEIVMNVIRNIGIPVITIYPLATILIGKLISDSFEKQNFVSKIRESEEKYRLLVENQTDMIVKVDPEGVFSYVSPTYCRMFGKKENELLGTKFIPLVNEEDVERTLKEMEKLKTHPYSCYIEQRAKTAQGWKWLSWTDTAVLDRDGSIKEIIGVGRDISAEIENREMLKKSNSKLSDNELKYRSLFENAPLPFQSLDPEGNIIDVNSEWLKTLGYSQPEVTGKWFGDFLHPDYIEHFRINFPKFKEAGSISGVQFRMKKKDGSFIYASFEGRIGYRPDGSAEKTYCVFKDMSDLAKTEHNLKMLSSRYSTLLDTVPDIIMEVDKNKIYTWANKAGYEFFGDDVIGKEASYYFEGEQNTYKIVKPLFEGKENVIYVESMQRRKDGKLRLLAWWSKVNKDEKGSILGGISSARDITEQKEYENRLGKKNKELSDLNSLMVDRELKMVELKNEINGLLKECGKEPKY